VLKLHLSFFVKVSAFALFFARAYELYFLKSPLAWTLSELGLNPGHLFLKFIALLLFAFAVLSLFISHKNFSKYWGFVLPAVVIKLSILFSYFWSNHFYWPKILEWSWQIFIPLLFLWIYKKYRSFDATRIYLKVLLCASLLPHALDSFALFENSSHYVYLTYRLLNIDQFMLGIPNQILAAFHLSMCFFVFVKSVRKPFLMYALILGLLVALARLVTGYNQDFVILSTKHFVFDCFLHLPLVLVPLSLLSLRVK
tara:strand:- start:17064 stop:17828 length:765 start_codon:yes stop_codon:yes gene_type:complete